MSPRNTLTDSNILNEGSTISEIRGEHYVHRRAQGLVRNSTAVPKSGGYALLPLVIFEV